MKSVANFIGLCT